VKISILKVMLDLIRTNKGGAYVRKELELWEFILLCILLVVGGRIL